MEEQECAQKEVEDMRKVEEKKRAEIEEDRRRRAELAEKEQKGLEQRRKESGKGRAREEVPEAGLSRPRKQRAESEEEGPSSKRPQGKSLRILVILLTSLFSSIRRSTGVSLSETLHAGLVYSMTGHV